MQLFSFYFFFTAQRSFLISVLVRGIKAITHAMSLCLRAYEHEPRWIAIGRRSRVLHCSAIKGALFTKQLTSTILSDTFWCGNQ